MEQKKLQKILKIIGYIICGIQLVISVLTSLYVIRLKVLPTSFLTVTIVLLIILVVILTLMQRWIIPGIIGKFISILISAVLVIACFYIDYTYKKLNDMSGVDTKIDNVDVYVLIDDPAQNINDAKGYNFGILSTLDRENTNNIIIDIESEVGQSISTTEYDSVKDLMQGLYDGTSQAIILNYAYLGFVSDDEEYGDFKDKTKVIFNMDYESTISTDDNIPADYLSDREGVFTVLLNGVDTRGTTIANSNSDTNIILTVNMNTHQILMINTPRDYYVPLSISGGIPDKLAHSGAYGVDVTIDTLEMLYNVNIDNYVRINFDGFMDIIDELGGITVYSEYDFVGYDSDVVNMSYHFNQGYNDLNGEQALLFARERHAFVDGDRQRGKNQMAVIEGMINKAISTEMLKNYTNVMERISDSVVTSMSYDEIAELVKYQLTDGPKWEILKYSVTGSDSNSTTYSTGSAQVYVMVPDENSVNKAKQYLEDIYSGRIVVIEEDPVE
ncbi:MAG: LCP family protein [Lachnospiraceae bacterium]|nr:LCP family protein [Lachnospiraceae bacterium]